MKNKYVIITKEEYNREWEDQEKRDLDTRFTGLYDERGNLIFKRSPKIVAGFTK